MKGHDSSSNPTGQDHFEFCWIVWRTKKVNTPSAMTTDGDGGNIKDVNLDLIRDGVSFRNPAYDLFMGQTGRKRGFLGYTYNTNLDKEKTTSLGAEKSEQYTGAYWNAASGASDKFTVAVGNDALQPSGEASLTVDDLMTMRLNKDDYVVMKDVRFFLGKEHGKSHFEDTLHWDWNDPIDTPHENVLSSPTLNNKSYRWFMTLLGTSGNKTICSLNY